MFRQISWLKIKISKNFWRWKSNDYSNINIFLSQENPCTFWLAKEKTWKYVFNTNSELPQNRTEKQIMPSKTTVNWLFTDIWCYLIIGCFDQKFVVFLQTAVRVYYILNVLLDPRCNFRYPFFSSEKLHHKYKISIVRYAYIMIYYFSEKDFIHWQ